MNKKNTFNLLLGLFILTVFAAIFIPSLLHVPNYNRTAVSSKMKQALYGVVDSCDYRKKNTTNFEDGFDYINKIEVLNNEAHLYEIQPIDPDTCFKAKAVPKNTEGSTWFEIELNQKTGKYSKRCGDASKEGCEEGNTW